MNKWRVTAKESGWTLLQFLRHVMPDLSAKRIKRELEGHRCQVNGRLERFSSTKVGTGDEIAFSISDEKGPRSSKILQIVYEDEALKIINKPSGLSVETLAKEIKDAVLVHRLDKPTSGLLILAKSESVFQNMVALFRDKQVEKTYLALVSGKVTAPNGKIENFLGKIHSMRDQAIWGAVEKGQYALTYWKRALEGKKGTLLEVQPVTGRTHQIRTHMASIGLPLAGDAQYGVGKGFIEAPRVMLHAYRLRFPHPTNFSIVDVVVNPPEDFISQMNKMGIVWKSGI